MNKLKELEKRVAQCTKCELHKERTNTVPGDGADDAEIMFIGEGPGKNEDEQGKPFVGAAGKFLTELIESIGKKREEVYIANVVKCRPPGNRDPLPEEVQACWPYLEEQIQIIKPKLIVTLGRHSMDRFIPNQKISYDHGKPKRREIEGLGKLVYYPIYHPAAALYNPHLRQTLIDDFARIPVVLKEIESLKVTEEKKLKEVAKEEDEKKSKEKQARLEV